MTFTLDAAGIPSSERSGVHDVAAFDINGDGRPDLVFGKCSGTQIFISESPCPWDLDGDATIGFADLLDLLSQWSTDPGGPPDFDGDGSVGLPDLLVLLSAWGSCGRS